MAFTIPLRLQTELKPELGQFQFPGASTVCGGVSFRALGTMVRPATSTIGRPSPATIQFDEPCGSFNTPQSLDTYTSPLTESYATPVAGKSGNQALLIHQGLSK